MFGLSGMDYHPEADSYYLSYIFNKNHKSYAKARLELEFVREWHTKTGRGEPGSNSRRN